MSTNLSHRNPASLKVVCLFLLFILVSLSADVVGTIYCHLDLEFPSAGVGTSVELTAITDSIRTVLGDPVLAADPCLQEYQTWRLHSTAGRPLGDIEPEAGDHCTGSPCYRDYYTHSSPFDLDRELVATACYFFVSDSLDSADAFLRTEYAFYIDCYRPGNLEISLTEKYMTDAYDEWTVVSDTATLTITGPAMDCPPMRAPKCGEVYDITPLEAKAVWHHVMLHEGYQYRINTSPTPPASGIDLDTNYIELTGLVSETSYYLHVRGWLNCETSSISYSPWTSIPFNTLPQPITTIQTSPEDLMFIAEGDTYYTTTEFDWPYEGPTGPCHLIEAVSPQSYPPDGAIYYYREWSDGSAISHCHEVGATNVTITCYYDSITADFMMQSAPPAIVCAGSHIDVSVTMLNSGSIEWTEWDNLYLWSQNPPMNEIWGLSEVEFEGSMVEPGETHTFEFTVIAPDTPGDYVFQWQMGKSGISFFGEKSDSVLITVEDKPTATASSGGPYCQNEIPELYGGPDGMVSYYWTGPGGFTSTLQAPVLPPGTPSMTGNYRLIVQNSYGCLDTANTYLTVNSKPSASASNTGPYCGGQAIQLTANPADMATYEWSGPLGFSSSDRIAIIPSADTSHAGTYSVIVTSDAGCVDTAFTSIIVYEKPEITASSNAPVCEGSILELRAEPPGLDSYFWYVPGGTIIPGRVIFRNPVSADMSGIYSVIGTSEDGCADTAWVMAIIDTVIKTLEIDSLTADSTFIFSGSITELHCFVSGAEGDLSYHWEPYESIWDPDTSDPMVAPSVTTTFEVTVTDSQECGIYQVSDTIIIQVMTDFECLIYIDSLTHDKRICLGDTIQLHVDAFLGVGTTDYRWSPNYNISSISSRTPYVYPETTTIYTVVAEDDSACTDTGYVEVSVSDVQIDIEPDSGHICVGGFIELIADLHGGIPPYEIAWTPATTISDPDSEIVIATPETTTTYRIIAVDSMSCYGIDYVTVHVDTPITTLYVEVSADDSSLILGESTRLHANAYDAGGSVGYLWTPEAYFDVPASPNPWATPPVSGWLKVAVTDYQEYCEYTIYDSIYIEVEDTSSCPLNITYITPDTHICLGDEIMLEVSVEGASGTVDYSWTPSSSLSDPSSPNPIATPNHTTFYWIIVSDDSCADSARVIVFVDTVHTGMRIVSVAATFDTIDIGDSTYLFSSITGESGDLSVHWTPVSSLSNPDSTETWAFPEEPTTYVITAMDSQECGVYEVNDSIHIFVNTWFGCSLSVTAFGADSICPGSSTPLDALTENAIGTSSFEWTPHTGLSDPYIVNPIASPSVTTPYVITAVDDSACIARDTVTIWVKTIDTGDLPELDICDTDTILLDLSMHAGVEPVSWTWLPDIFLSDADISSPSCWADSSLTYTVIASDAEDCADTIEIPITVDSMRTGMEVNLSPDTSIIFGGEANLRAEITDISGSVRWFWSPPSWLDDPYSLTPTATPPTTTVYTFTALDSQLCGVYSVDDSVIVDIIPEFECSLEVTPAFEETTVCRGSSVQLETSLSGEMGDVAYEWIPVDYLDFPDSANPVASELDSTITYTIIVTDDSCADSSNIIIHVTRVISLLDSVINICRGDTAEMWGELINPTGEITYEWSPDLRLSHPDSNYTMAFPETTTEYILIASDDAGCSDSIVVNIEVDSILITMLIDAYASPYTIAPGDSALLTVVIDGEVGEVSIEWDTADGIVESPTEDITWAFPDSSMWFTVTVRDSQECGIYSITDSVFVEVGMDPCSLEVSIVTPDSICRGDSVELTSTAEGANGQINWLWRPSTGLSDTASESIWASPTVTTFYWAIATDTLGCKDSNGVSVVIRETPTVLAMAIDETLYIGEDLELRAYPADSSFIYEWSGPAGFLSNDRINFVNDIDTSQCGWYSVSVTNEIGCTGVDSVNISVLTPPAYPDIALSSPWLEFDIYEGETEDRETLQVSNAGDSTLLITSLYRAISLDEFTFADITPVEIDPDSSEVVVVTFEASVIGDYRDTLIIESNDPDESRLALHLLGHVHPPDDPDIGVFPEILDFGAVIVDSCERDSVYISNSGGGLLIINDVAPEATSVAFIRPPLPDTLTLNEGKYYVFEFCPTAAGSLNTWIDTESNDPDESLYQLLALGLGIIHAGYSVSTEVVTPNGDGLNDIIEFNVPDGESNWNVEIYDSRGNLITSGHLENWDARENGSTVPIGTYYYRLSSGGETRISGAIAVIY